MDEERGAEKGEFVQVSFEARPKNLADDSPEAEGAEAASDELKAAGAEGGEEKDAAAENPEQKDAQPVQMVA